LLRQTLGSKFSPAILEQVREAESVLIDRKNHLADLVDAGVMAEEQFADLVNRVLSVYLRAVTDIVGEDACRRMYDFGPDDEVKLLNPRELRRRTEYLATPEILAGILTDELIIAGNTVSVQGDENDLDNELRSIAQFVAVKGEWMILGSASRDEVSRWQAAILAAYLANRISGNAVKQLIWRICKKTMLLGGCRLQASADAVDEFYRLCLGTRIEPDGDMGIYAEAEEIEQIEQWLSNHRQSAGSAPLIERDN
jgi:hypothetical protein